MSKFLKSAKGLKNSKLEKGLRVTMEDFSYNEEVFLSSAPGFLDPNVFVAPRSPRVAPGMTDGAEAEKQHGTLMSIISRAQR
jgi:hypothetical protein